MSVLPECPGCGGHIKSFGDLLVCEAPECTWAESSEVFVKSLNSETKALHKFASTQFNIADASPLLASEILTMAERIPDEELAKDGRETEPHVTIKYGLHTDYADEVKMALAEWMKLHGKNGVLVTLRETSLFVGDEFDVVKITVESDVLRSLNEHLSSFLECTDTHPEYIPHVTLAYVKSGLGEQYVDAYDVYGEEVTLRQFIFSDADGKRTMFDMATYETDQSLFGEKSMMEYGEKAGYTGERKDKLGRRSCWDDGKRVACNRQGAAPKKQGTKKPDAAKPDKAKEKVNKQATVKAAIEKAFTSAREIAKDPNKATPEQVKAVGDALLSLTLPEIRKLKAELKVTGGGTTKAGNVEAIKKQALEGNTVKPTPQKVAKKPVSKTPTQQVKRIATDTEVGKLLAEDTEGQQAVATYAATFAAEAKQIQTLTKKKLSIGKTMNNLSGNKFAAVMDEYRRVDDEITTLAKGQRDRQHAELKKQFAPTNPADIKVQLSDGFSDEGKSQCAKAQAFLQGLVSDTFGKLTDIQAEHLDDGGRANYRKDGNRILLTNNTGPAVTAHEIGHALNEDPRVRKLANDFVKARLGDEQRVKMKDMFPQSGYSDDEEGAKDDFGKAFNFVSASHAYYAGKVYQDGQTEIVSMGVEQLFRDPAHFAQNDPEYFQFIVGVVSGRLLEKVSVPAAETQQTEDDDIIPDEDEDQILDYEE